MSTATPGRPGQRTIGVPRTTDQAGPRGGTGKTAQARWEPGTGQAVALNKAAAAATTRHQADTGGRGKISRAQLIRAAIHDSLTLDAADLAAAEPVPAAPSTAPKGERSVTWVPEPGLLQRIDDHAAAANLSRNEAIRRYVARWLEQHA